MTDALTARAAQEWRAERDSAERPRALRHPAPPAADPDGYGAQPPPAPIGADATNGEPSGTPELPVVSAASLADRPVAERRWIVPGMIPDRTVTLVSGDGAVGKSTLLLQFAAAKAAGVPWLGVDLDPGPVTFVSAEDDLDELHRRLVLIARGLTVSLEDLANLHLIPLAGRDAVLGAPDGKGIIAPTVVWRGLVATVERVRPHLVILDTLADIFAGNENARAEARQFVGLLRGLAIDHRLAVVLIGHPSLAGMATGSGTSGSTAWNNSVRSRLYLETTRDEDGCEIDADMRVLRVMKANYAAAGVEWPLRWRDGCFIVDGPVGGLDKMGADAKAERVFLTLLTTFQAQERPVSPSPSSSYAPKVFAAHPDGEGLSKKTLAAAMERLLAAGRLRIETCGPPSRQYKRLVFVPPRDDP